MVDEHHVLLTQGHEMGDDVGFQEHPRYSFRRLSIVGAVVEDSEGPYFSELHNPEDPARYAAIPKDETFR